MLSEQFLLGILLSLRCTITQTSLRVPFEWRRLAYERLDSFLPFDLESVSSSGFVLATVDAVYPGFVPERQWLDTVLDILQEMASNGNALARVRHEEIKFMVTMLESLEQHENSQSSPHTAIRSGIPANIELVPYQTSSPVLLDDLNHQEGFSAAQILSVAEALEFNDFTDLWAQDLTGPPPTD